VEKPALRLLTTVRRLFSRTLDISFSACSPLSKIDAREERRQRKKMTRRRKLPLLRRGLKHGVNCSRSQAVTWKRYRKMSTV